MSNPYRGIYYVEGKVLFPTQIIVTKELDREGHIWLKALSGQLGKEDILGLLDGISRLTEKMDKEFADSVLEVSIGANKQIVEELKGDGSMYQALMEITGWMSGGWRIMNNMAGSHGYGVTGE